MPGQRLAFLQPIEMRMNEMVSGVARRPGRQAVRRRSRRAGDKGQGDRSDLEPDSRQRPTSASSRSPASRCCRSSSNQEQLARYGVPAKVVIDLIESIGSKPLGEVIEGQLRFPLVVRLPDDNARRRRGDRRRSWCRRPSGERLPLSRLADIRDGRRARRRSPANGASGGSPSRPTSAAATSAASWPRPSSKSKAELAAAAGPLLRTNSAGSSSICSGPARGC